MVIDPTDTEKFGSVELPITETLWTPVAKLPLTDPL